MRTSARGITDTISKIPAIEYYQLLSVTATTTVAGYFINEAGLRTGVSFTGTVTTSTPKRLQDIAGQNNANFTLPQDAVGWVGSISADVYVDLTTLLPALNADFIANPSNYRKVTKSSRLGLGRVAEPMATNLALEGGVDVTLSATSIGINDGSVTTQKLSVSTAGAAAVAGDVAHDGVDAGNPVKIGGQARSSERAVVSTNGDRVDFVADMVGKQIVAPYANPENLISGSTSDITDTTSTSCIAAQSAGVRSYITNILIQNSHATVSTWVKVLDGATIKYRVYAAAAGGGASITLPCPLVGTAATAWNIQPETTGANVRGNLSGYKGV